MRLSLRASEGESIDSNSDWFTQMMDHVRLGYGQAVMTGASRESGAQSKFTETAEGGAVEATESVRVEDDAVELSRDDLMQAQQGFVERGDGVVLPSEFDEETDEQPD